MSNNMDHLNQVKKVVVIGDQGVGKTKLLSRFLYKKYEDKGTIGVEFGCKNIICEDKTIQIQIWDTAGKPLYDDIIRSYFRGTAIMLLVIAGRDKADKIEQISHWLQKISDQNIHPTIIIIENKSDVAGVVPLNNKDLAQFHDRYKLFIRCSAESAECISQLTDAFQSILPKILADELRPNRNAAAAAPPLTMPNRYENDIISTNIRKLDNQQADLILKALHNLLIHGPVHIKHYQINFGKGKPIDNTKIGQLSKGEMITVPEHAHQWITVIRAVIADNSQNKVQLLAQLYIEINNVANEKRFSRNATTQDFYQHCLPGFIDECSKQGDADRNYFTLHHKIMTIRSEDSLKTIVDELISHLEAGNQKKLPDGNARYSLGFLGGKTHKLLQTGDDVKVTEHVASLLDYLINDKATPTRDKLIFALNYANAIKCSTSSSRHDTTQSFYNNLPAFIAEMVSTHLNPRTTLHL